MWFDAFDDALKIMIVRDWCGPHDYLAMVATTKIWSCAYFLRNAACFAVSRMHVPGLESSFAMAHWNLVWKECVEVFHARNWSAALWKDCCTFQKGDFLLVLQSPFFKGLNLMVATHIVDDAVASILAVTIDNVGTRSIDALLMLQSGQFAFLGCADCVKPSFGGASFCKMLVNAVASSSLRGVEAETVKYVLSYINPITNKHLWYLDRNGLLRIFFCYRGLCIAWHVHIEDSFVFIFEELR